MAAYGLHTLPNQQTAALGDVIIQGRTNRGTGPDLNRINAEKLEGILISGKYILDDESFWELISDDDVYKKKSMIGEERLGNHSVKNIAAKYALAGLDYTMAVTAGLLAMPRIDMFVAAHSYPNLPSGAETASPILKDNPIPFAKVNIGTGGLYNDTIPTDKNAPYMLYPEQSGLIIQSLASTLGAENVASNMYSGVSIKSKTELMRAMLNILDNRETVVENLRLLNIPSEELVRIDMNLSELQEHYERIKALPKELEHKGLLIELNAGHYAGQMPVAESDKGYHHPAEFSRDNKHLEEIPAVRAALCDALNTCQRF